MIVYIGNILSGRGRSKSVIELLSSRLNSKYEIRLSSSRENKVLRLFDMLSSVFKYRKKASVVLIDTYSTSAFWYASATALLCRLLDLPYIPILHGGNLPRRYESAPRVMQFFLSGASRVVSPSLYLFDFFTAKGFSITYIPNFIDIQDYQYKDRSEIGAKLLWVRAFHEIYNPSLAIKVLKRLSSLGHNPSLCMVGAFKDDSIKEVRQLVEQFELQTKVEITGILTKSQWIEKAKEYDIFINTTNVDNMPISVVEAMALGLPVVSTNVGGMPYLIRSSENGFLVGLNNPLEMVDAIRQLLSNPVLCNKIVREARARVELLDWERVKYNWFELLDSYEKA